MTEHTMSRRDTRERHGHAVVEGMVRHGAQCSWWLYETVSEIDAQCDPESAKNGVYQHAGSNVIATRDFGGSYRLKYTFVLPD